MIKGIIVKCDGTVETKEFSQPLFKSVGVIVDGNIERVNPRGLPKGFIFFCNEEFIGLNLSPNFIGSILYQNPESYIGGDIVIFKEAHTSGGIDCVDMTIIEQQNIIKILDEIKIQIKETRI